MKRLLVGVDDSRNSRTALRWAARVADPLGAELVAIRCWAPRRAERPGEAGAEHRDVEAELLEEARKEAPGITSIRTDVVEGPAIEVLLDRAESEDADLVVVGFRGEGGFLGLHLGSVADALAHRTTRPLAIVPDTTPVTPQRIVLGVEGSEGAAVAANWCARFAADLGAAVTAVSVFAHQFELLPDQDPNSVFQYFEHALQNEWTAPLRDAGVAVTPELLKEPHVADALIQEAQRIDAHVIVAGTHGRAPLVHLRTGGVAMRLLHSTPIPLVVVPPSWSG